MGSMRMFEKMAGANTVILTVCILVIIYLLYSFIGSSTEVCYYYVSELTKNSKIMNADKDSTYTNHTHAKLYNSRKKPVGVVSSVNFHHIIDGVNRVTTVTTFTTKKGTIVCNLYYETSTTNNYMTGIKEDVTPEHLTGDYDGKKVIIRLNGKPDGERELTIQTSNYLF